MNELKKASIQIQSVIYKNDVDGLIQALDNIANAIRVDRQIDQVLSWVRVCYGDASPERVFTPEQVAEITETYREFFTFHYEFFNKNSGTAAGHNRMARDCEADYLQIMNPDVVISPHLFKYMLEPFSVEGLRAGMTEARQTPVEHHKEYDVTTGITSWATTALALFPLHVFKEVGGFDQDTFFMYCDDVDFSWMVRMAGYQVIYVPSAVAFHAKRLSASGKWQPTAAEVYYSAEAALLMCHKWSNPELLDKILHSYLDMPDDSPEYKAAQEYLSRKDAGRLPTPRDSKHKVADFVGYGYGKSRFEIV